MARKIGWSILLILALALPPISRGAIPQAQAREGTCYQVIEQSGIRTFTSDDNVLYVYNDPANLLPKGAIFSVTLTAPPTAWSNKWTPYARARAGGPPMWQIGTGDLMFSPQKIVLGIGTYYAGPYSGVMTTNDAYPNLWISLFNASDGWVPVTTIAYTATIIFPAACPDPAISRPIGPGSDMVPIPAYAVVGMFKADTALYFAPNPGSSTGTTMPAGKTLWVSGVNKTGEFYQVLLSGVHYWVPVETIGPNPDNVWNNTPLPTEVVE